MAPRRRDQPRLGMEVGDVQEDRERLEDEALVVLDHRHPAEWMAGDMALAAPLVPVISVTS